MQDELKAARKLLRKPALQFTKVAQEEYLYVQHTPAICSFSLTQSTHSFEVKIAEAKTIVPADWVRINATKQVHRYRSPSLQKKLDRLEQWREKVAAGVWKPSAEGYEDRADRLPRRSCQLRVPCFPSVRFPLVSLSINPLTSFLQGGRLALRALPPDHRRDRDGRLPFQPRARCPLEQLDATDDRRRARSHRHRGRSTPHHRGRLAEPFRAERHLVRRRAAQADDPHGSQHGRSV